MSRTVTAAGKLYSLVEPTCMKYITYYRCFNPSPTHTVQVVEWYHPWANLAPTLTQYMDEQDEVLVCGCGNSEMSVDMYDDGEALA